MEVLGIALAVGLVGAQPDIESIVLGMDAPSAGVRYAADILAQELQVEVRLGEEQGAKASTLRVATQGSPLLREVPRQELGEDGFAWDVTSAPSALVADSQAGLMYGLLEMAERVRDEEPLPGTLTSSPLVGLRGDVIDLPMYLGCDLYDGRWRWHMGQEADPDHWFHDRDGWRERLRLLARRRINAILIGHPHPFPAFIDYPQAPEAEYFPAEVVERNAETLRWLITESAEYGVRLYFLTWNEWVPRGWAEAHGVPQEGPGTVESAALNRYSYAELYRRFPGLGGLVTMAGESPPGCVEFVRENVIGALAALEDPPHVIFWTWCCYPEDVNYVLDGYPGPTSIMHYLQYEQLFLPRIDPRVGRMSRECGGRPVIVLGGLGTATGMLYWGSPDVIRGIMQDVPRENVGGVFFSGLDSWSWISNKWIGWEALARYHWDPFRDEEQERRHWHRRIADVVGHADIGPPLLTAYEAASAVPMLMLYLTHSQSDVFRPQYGMPLIFYLGMPTLSTYVFENHETIDEQGRLSPRMGLTWPNPDWGIRVIPIIEFVAAESDGRTVEGMTPLDVAGALEDKADLIGAAVAQLRPLAGLSSWSPERYDIQLRLLTLSEYLARHYAAKVRAAVGWERWRAGMADAAACLEPLAQSVEYFRRYAQTMVELYPQRYGTRINVLTKSLPWTHLDLWRNYVYLPEYDFMEFADRYAREYDLIEAAMAAGRTELPFALDLVAPLEGEVVASLSEDGLSPGLTVQSFGDEAWAAVEGATVSCSFRGTHADFYFPVVSDPAALPIEKGVWYEVVLRYRVSRVGDTDPLRLSIGARTTEGGWRKDVGTRYFEPGAGTSGEVRTRWMATEFDDYYFYLSMNGDGGIVIERLTLTKSESGPE